MDDQVWESLTGGEGRARRYRTAVRSEGRRLVGVTALVVSIGLAVIAVVHRSSRGSGAPQPTDVPQPDGVSQQGLGDDADMKGGSSKPMTFVEFQHNYGELRELMSPSDVEQAETYIAENKLHLENSSGPIGCHRIDGPVRDVATVPFPQEWCDAVGKDAKKTYLWLIGDPYTGTTGTLGMLVNAKNVSNLCIFEDNELFHLCEGFKYVAPEDVLKGSHWNPKTWPKDMRTDVIESWRDLWHDPTRPIRIDKSPPWSIRVGQIVDDLLDRDGTRIAFIFLTRSRCSTARTNTGQIDLFALEYEYLLRRKIPVMHVRYEDYVRDLDAVKRKVHEWCPCLKIPAKTGFLPLFKELYGGDQELQDSYKDRFRGIEEYLDGKTFETLQQPYGKGISKRHPLALKYFGYDLVPYTDATGQ